MRSPNWALLFFFMPAYPNGTGNELKTRRLNCLWVRIPSPVLAEITFCVMGEQATMKEVSLWQLM